jgi:sedoheptulokinase
MADVKKGQGLVYKNRPLRRIMQEIFGLTPKIPLHREEAAFGAALFALVAAKKYKSVTEAAAALVRYEEQTQ